MLALLFAWYEAREGDLASRSGARIEQLYAEQQSGALVEAVAVVSKVLPDDNRGSRHQRIIVRLDSGHTLLVSHNIDLAPRVDSVRAGDTLGFRGQYEWNSQGGVVHWTHDDPAGRHPGGWLQHDGQTYR